MKQSEAEISAVELRPHKMDILKSLSALALIGFLPFGIMIWFRNHQSTGFALNELILYPLLFGGSSVMVIYLLKVYFLKESLYDFNTKEGRFVKDILWGFILTIIYFIVFYIERLTLINWLTFIPNMELLDLMTNMREEPLLLAFWFGPVLWIGVALYEELVKVFILSSLWKIDGGKFWTIIIMTFVSFLMGLVHMNQGSYGIATIALKSFIACYFFYKFRRLLPLIIAHVLYDGIQVAVFIITWS